jgi:hypothetical protein
MKDERWVGHVTGMGEKENRHIISVGKGLIWTSGISWEDNITSGVQGLNSEPTFCGPGYKYIYKNRQVFTVTVLVSLLFKKTFDKNAMK